MPDYRRCRVFDINLQQFVLVYYIKLIVNSIGNSS